MGAWLFSQYSRKSSGLMLSFFRSQMCARTTATSFRWVSPHRTRGYSRPLPGLQSTKRPGAGDGVDVLPEVRTRTAPRARVLLGVRRAAPRRLAFRPAAQGLPVVLV